MQGLQAVNVLGTWTNETRVGLDLLTDKAENFINFDSCCVQMTVKDLLSKISEGLTMYNQTLVEQLQMGYDGDLSPHKIDLEQSLQTIKGNDSWIELFQKYSDVGEQEHHIPSHPITVDMPREHD